MIYKIKLMTEEQEIKEKAQVHCISWHETYKDLIDDSYNDSVTLEKCTEYAENWSENTLIAKVDEKVVGFLGFGKYRDNTLPDCGEVYALYILNAYHHKGIGTHLMTTAIKRLHRYQKIAVWVLSTNTNAINFYKSYGFKFDNAENIITLGTPVKELRMIYEKPTETP